LGDYLISQRLFTKLTEGIERKRGKEIEEEGEGKSL